MGALGVSMAGRPARTDLDDAVAACRSTVWILWAFSFAANLLILAPPLYMLQVYDRVMVTGRVETLVALTAMVAVALLLFGCLDALRSSISTRIGCWLNARLGPVYLANGVRARLTGDSAGAQPLRDLAMVQGFIASPAPGVFFDMVWTPAFLALIWTLHPWLGLLGVAAAALLFSIGLANECATRSQNAVAMQAQIAATQQAEATIRNAEVVRAMSMLPALVERWRASNAAGLAATRRLGRWNEPSLAVGASTGSVALLAWPRLESRRDKLSRRRWDIGHGRRVVDKRMQNTGPKGTTRNLDHYD